MRRSILAGSVVALSMLSLFAACGGDEAGAPPAQPAGGAAGAAGSSGAAGSRAGNAGAGGNVGGAAGSVAAGGAGAAGGLGGTAGGTAAGNAGTAGAAGAAGLGGTGGGGTAGAAGTGAAGSGGSAGVAGAAGSGGSAGAAGPGGGAGAAGAAGGAGGSTQGGAGGAAGSAACAPVAVSKHVTKAWPAFANSSDPDVSYRYFGSADGSNQWASVGFTFASAGLGGKPLDAATAKATTKVFRIATEKLAPSLGQCGTLELGVRATSEKPLVFDGTDVLVLDPAKPLVGGTAVLEAGTSRLSVVFDPPVSAQVPLTLFDSFVAQIEVVHVVVDVSANHGVLHGFLKQEAIASDVIPAVGASVRAAIAAGSGSAQTYLDTFDADKDGAVTDAEVAGNPTLQSLLAVDLDAFNNGVFGPNKDGVNDALSVGIAFDLAGCSF